MKLNWIVLIYSILFILSLLMEYSLIFLNIRSVLKNKYTIPACLKGKIDFKKHVQSADYTLTKNYFTLFQTFITSSLVLLLFVGGFLGQFETFYGTIFHNKYILLLAYVFSVYMVFRFSQLPMAAFYQFRVEKSFGFNKMGCILFATDFFKDIILTIAIYTPIMVVVQYIVFHYPDTWWLTAFVLLFLIRLLLSFLYPLIIAPLFNKFVPLDDSELLLKIQEMSFKLNFKFKGIYIMDGSRRTNHQNAYFTGFGATRRVVIFDTMLKSMTKNEITAVIAHEIGHWRKNHILKSFIITELMSFLFICIVFSLFHYKLFFTAFSFANPSIGAMIVIIFFCIEPFAFFFKPFSSFFSRRMEFQADDFAANDAGMSEHLTSALIKLNRENLSNVTPSSIYSFWNYTHPALPSRLAALGAFIKTK